MLRKSKCKFSFLWLHFNRFTNSSFTLCHGFIRFTHVNFKRYTRSRRSYLFRCAANSAGDNGNVSNGGSSGLSKGAIAVSSSVLVLGLILLLLLFFLLRLRRRRAGFNQNDHTNNSKRYDSEKYHSGTPIMGMALTKEKEKVNLPILTLLHPLSVHKLKKKNYYIPGVIQLNLQLNLPKVYSLLPLHILPNLILTIWPKSPLPRCRGYCGRCHCRSSG